MLALHLRKTVLTALLCGLSTTTLAGTTDPLSMSWDLPEAALRADGRLAVELDGYDISPFTEISDNRLTIKLDTPLTPGSHQLAVVVFLANGDIETVMTETLDVAASDQTEWQANATLDSHYRAAMKDKSEYQAIPHAGSTGGINASSRTTQGNWQVDSTVQAMYDSVSENNSDNDEWALAHYQVAAKHTGEQLITGIAVGHIDVDRNDLLFSSFQRRGVTAGLEQRDGDFKLQVFGLQSDPTTRYDGDLLVPEDASEKSTGATASLAIAGEQLLVSVGYIDGEGTLGGAGYSDNGDPTIYGGQSWNVALDSYWLNRSVWLHGEYAESEFDRDGIGLGEDEQTDTASQAFIKLSSDGDLSTSAVDYWSVLLHYQTVGIDFYSMGNLYLPGDMSMQRLFAQTSLQGLSAELEWAEEESNTDDDPNLPTQTLQRQTLNLSYTPMTINPDALAWRVLGMPSGYFNYQVISYDQLGSDAALTGYDLDNDTEVMALGLQFSGQTLNWELKHQVTHYNDNSNTLIQSGFVVYEPSSDTSNNLTELLIGWTPGERLSLNVYTQWNELVEEDSNDKYNNDNYGIDGYWLIVPELLNLTLNYNQSRDRSDLQNSLFVEDDFTADVANFQLNWTALQARERAPGITAYLRGSYGKQHNHALSEEQETWAAHIGLEIQWAGGQP